MAQEYSFDKYPFLKELGLEKVNNGCWNGESWTGNGKVFHSVNPSNTSEIVAEVRGASVEDYEVATKNMVNARDEWMKVITNYHKILNILFNQLPIPKRGEIIRQIGDALRKHKAALGRVVSLEVGKIIAEGEGEVQEIIDICDMACGLSRTLNG